MARQGGLISGNHSAIPVVETFKRGQHTTVVAGVAVLAIPETNMSYRKGLFVQNNHASNGLYLGMCDPQFIIGNQPSFLKLKASGLAEDIRSLYTFYDVKWKVSVGGTNEWYAVHSSGAGTPSITQPTILYYVTANTQAVGSETLGTNGTVGALAAQHGWGWGDGDTLGYSTLYIRTNGTAAANSPMVMYDYFMFYPLSLTADTATSTGGLQVDAGSTMWLTLDGTTRLFGIASGATTPVAVLEVA